MFRLTVEGRDQLPAGPALLCFNHQSWIDPFLLMAVLPWRPRLSFFGPKEADMQVGGRNRLIRWTGMAVPYRPDKGDPLGASRRVRDVFAAGGVLAIAGEGRIHGGEAELLPLSEGPAFFALSSGVPIVPIAINGTSWLAFRRHVRIRIGRPIPAEGRASREAVHALTDATWTALHELCAGYPDPEPPRPGSRWYRWTEQFNEWPEGARPVASPTEPGEAEPSAEL